MMPETIASVSGLGGAPGRVANAIARPPPCRTHRQLNERGLESQDCGTYSRVTHDEHWDAGILPSHILDPPLEVAQFDHAVRLAVRLVCATVLFVECCASEPAHVVREDRDAALGTLRMESLVAADVISKTMDED